VECTDVKLYSGELRGWPELNLAAPVHDFADAQTYKFVTELKANDGDTTFFGSLSETASIVPDPAVDEAFDRFYLFDVGVAVKVATFTQIDLGQAPDDLALPVPTVAPTLIPASGAPDGSTPSEDRVYVITWQTSWGEETEPSPSATVQVAADDSVELSDIEQPSAIAGRTWDKINIYRSVAGTTSVAFYFVASVVPPVSIYTDDLSSAYVVYNRALDAFSNEAPPDGLQGARVHPSGALAAFLGRKVWFSRPFLPHAWPAQFAVVVDDAIVGIEIYGQSIVVMTESFVYLIYGQTPGSFGLRKFPFASPGLSYRSIVPSEAGVYFCSTRGLIYVDDTGPQNITALTVNPDEWETEFFNGDVVAVMYDKIYMAWDRTAGGFMIDMNDQRRFISRWQSTPSVSALTKHWLTGDILVTIDDIVYKWDDVSAGPAPREYTWQSKTYYTPRPVNYGALQIEGSDSGSAQVEVFANGILKFDELVNFHEQRRLPSGFKATDWAIRVVSTDNIQDIAIGETGKDLAIV
jgi:hypothetical protein